MQTTVPMKTATLNVPGASICEMRSTASAGRSMRSSASDADDAGPLASG